MTVTMVANNAPVISGFNASSPLAIGAAVGGGFTIIDMDGDQVKNLRVHVSRSFDGSECVMDAGNYDSLQNGGAKSFSGCSAMTAIAGTLYLKLEGRDSRDKQATVVRLTVTVAMPVNNAPVISAFSPANPLLTGAPVSGSFSINDPDGDQVKNLRVHVSRSFDGSECTMDAGIYDSLQNGGAKSFSGCSAMTAIAGTLYLKLEGRDSRDKQATVVRVTVTVAVPVNNGPVISAFNPANPLLIGAPVSGSFSISDPDGDQVKNLRVHVSRSFDGSECTMDAGNYDSLQNGGSKSFSGCANMTASAGFIYLKVEGRDSKDRQATVLRTTVTVVALVNNPPIISGFSATTPLMIGAPIGGAFTITDPDGDMLKNVRVHVSRSYDGSECVIDIGNYDSLQLGGSKSFSGCASMSASAAILYLKVEGRDSKDKQALVQHRTVTVQGPAVTGVSPLTGFRNTTVRIVVTGTGLPATLIINIDGQATGCSRVSVTSTSASFNCPLSLAGVRLLEVKTNVAASGGIVIERYNFTVQ